MSGTEVVGPGGKLMVVGGSRVFGRGPPRVGTSSGGVLVGQHL